MRPRDEMESSTDADKEASMEVEVGRVLARFKNEEGVEAGAPLELPLNINTTQLTLLCNSLLNREVAAPFQFFVNDAQIQENLEKTLGHVETEKILEITYVEQAVFRVHAVTRCSGSIPGHAEAVISASFSPDGKYLASGSGDTTVRLWDINTYTTEQVWREHKHWVLCIAWSPDGKKLASGCKNSQVCIWNPAEKRPEKQLLAKLSGHKGWINSLSWEPMHRNPECRRLASSSKDGMVRVWDVVRKHPDLVISSHTASVTCVKWGGSGLIYTASQDKTIRVFQASDGKLCRILKTHSHWVNSLTLNVDYVLRTGPFEPGKDLPGTTEQQAKLAQERYQALVGSWGELMVSCSDDLTLCLWKPEVANKHEERMGGHQGPINDVRYSPDGRTVASASFDKSVKLWNGRTGKFLLSLLGHVQKVYQVSWAPDSRLLVSGSADSTLKLWDPFNTRKQKRLSVDLPGHADEIYAVDWSPDGQRVASGGKDKVLKIWMK